ncbi:MAG TPA: thioredoxin family protein [Terracidiphilus sp.]|nr:thioredoxin family protein [Terracidiphilus sp.]
MFRARALVTIAAALLLSVSPASPANRDIYPAPEQARADLAAALKTAAVTHKRILLDFGGNWCGDCQVLDIYMHNARNKPILDANYVLVHINIGRMDENVDIAKRYEIPLDRGVPAMAVLTEKGKLIYSQQGGQFEAMRRMQATAVTDFLVQWKPVKPGCSAVDLTC